AASAELVEALLAAQAWGCWNRDPPRQQPVAGAEQAGRPGALELREGLAFGRAGVLQWVGHRVYGRQHEARLGGRGPGQLREALRGFLVEARAALVLLPDVGLDDA